MTPRNVEDVYPLSPMQQLMLLHEVTHPDSKVLANQVWFRLEGELRVEAFRESWNVVVERHPALRTAFLWDGLDEPLQVVRERVQVPFSYVDLADLPDAERTVQVERLLEADRQAPFDLARAPLLRCGVVRTGRDAHVFYWSVHHLVVDRWSDETVFSELRSIYESQIGGDDPGLAPAPAFREYLTWIASQDLDEGRAFWREELRGFEAATLLAPGSAIRRPPRARTRLHLPADVSARVEEAAVSMRASLGSVLLTAVGVAAGRRLESDDVVCGLTVTGRPAHLNRVEDTVGCFVNNVPMRFRLESESSVRDFVRTVQLTQVRRHAFEYVSPAMIREVATLPARDPLFDLLLLLNLTEREFPSWTGLDLVPVEATLDAGYPLVLGISKDSEGIGWTLVHDEGYEEAQTLLESLRTALVDLCETPADAPLGELLASNGSSQASERRAPAPAAVVASELRDVPSQVLAVWREVLGMAEFGYEDDFITWGGTSIQAAAISRRVGRICGRSLPLELWARATTVRAQLEVLEVSARIEPGDD